MKIFSFFEGNRVVQSVQRGAQSVCAFLQNSRIRDISKIALPLILFSSQMVEAYAYNHVSCKQRVEEIAKVLVNCPGVPIDPIDFTTTPLVPQLLKKCDRSDRSLAYNLFSDVIARKNKEMQTVILSARDFTAEEYGEKLLDIGYKSRVDQLVLWEKCILNGYYPETVA